MTAQPDLFSPANLAGTVYMPLAPRLVPHDWPYPGLTPEESAQAAIANSEAYYDMLAAVIKQQGEAVLTRQHVLTLIPEDWRQVCGRFAHGCLDVRPANQRGIDAKYVGHDDGGFHFEYRVIEK